MLKNDLHEFYSIMEALDLVEKSEGNRSYFQKTINDITKYVLNSNILKEKNPSEDYVSKLKSVSKDFIEMQKKYYPEFVNMDFLYELGKFLLVNDYSDDYKECINDLSEEYGIPDNTISKLLLDVIQIKIKT